MPARAPPLPTLGGGGGPGRSGRARLGRGGGTRRVPAAAPATPEAHSRRRRAGERAPRGEVGKKGGAAAEEGDPRVRVMGAVAPRSAGGLVAPGPQRIIPERELAKLLHEPTVRLKDAAGTPRGERLSESLRHLFDLA